MTRDDIWQGVRNKRSVLAGNVSRAYFVNVCRLIAEIKWTGRAFSLFTNGYDLERVNELVSQKKKKTIQI